MFRVDIRLFLIFLCNSKAANIRHYTEPGLTAFGEKKEDFLTVITQCILINMIILHINTQEGLSMNLIQLYKGNALQ